MAVINEELVGIMSDILLITEQLKIWRQCEFLRLCPTNYILLKIIFRLKPTFE
jgi:hypothetical protein